MYIASYIATCIKYYECILLLLIAIVVLASGRANFEDAMLTVIDTIIPPIHDFLQSNTISQVSSYNAMHITITRALPTLVSSNTSDRYLQKQL